MTANEILRLVTIASSAAGIVVMLLVANRWRDRWLYTIAPLVYLTSALLLAMISMCLPKPINLETAEVLNTLSYIVRLESIITIIAAGVIFLTWRPKQ